MSRDLAIVKPAARHRAFLEHLAATGSPQGAARLSGFPLEAAQALCADDEGFADAWELAEKEADAALENEVRRRALEVIERPLFRHHHPVLNRDGTPVMVRRYNDRMMILMLKYIDQREF